MKVAEHEQARPQVKLKDFPMFSFKSFRQLSSANPHPSDFILPSMKMVNTCRADDFSFFQPFIDAGKLTIDQMRRAAARYFLGKTRSGQPIFWMIDDMLSPLDAHIGDGWISTFLKAREPLLQYWQVQHCLFGLHLLNHTDITDTTETKSVSPVKSVVENMPVCLVESEQSAVVLSEFFPESLWMAYTTTPHLSPDLLIPLEGRAVTIYPRTDSTMSTYLFFMEYADMVLRHHSLTLHISPILERHASPAQKARGIDILDYIVEGCDSVRTEPCSHEFCRAQAGSAEGQGHTETTDINE